MVLVIRVMGYSRKQAELPCEGTVERNKFCYYRPSFGLNPKEVSLLWHLCTGVGTNFKENSTSLAGSGNTRPGG